MPGQRRIGSIVLLWLAAAALAAPGCSRCGGETERPVAIPAVPADSDSEPARQAEAVAEPEAEPAFQADADADPDPDAPVFPMDGSMRPIAEADRVGPKGVGRLAACADESALRNLPGVRLCPKAPISPARRCYTTFAADASGMPVVGFWVFNGRFALAEIRESMFRTERGVAVGDRLARIFSLYPDAVFWRTKEGEWTLFSPAAGMAFYSGERRAATAKEVDQFQPIRRMDIRFRCEGDPARLGEDWLSAEEFFQPPVENEGAWFGGGHAGPYAACAPEAEIRRTPNAGICPGTDVTRDWRCYALSPAQAGDVPPLWLYVENGRLTHAVQYARPFQTPHGLAVGDAYGRLKEIYPKATVEKTADGGFAASIAPLAVTAFFAAAGLPSAVEPPADAPILRMETRFDCAGR
ncbi:MAG: hypothetical protein C4523_20395 [Myxococcales bacterium]|nr:MAG: hypothetical protein C4523_20395 [Myxococcales bacterium]